MCRITENKRGITKKGFTILIYIPQVGQQLDPILHALLSLISFSCL